MKRGLHCEVLALPRACFYFDVFPAKFENGLGGFCSIRLGNLASFGNRGTKAEHVPDNMLNVAGTR